MQNQVDGRARPATQRENAGVPCLRTEKREFGSTQIRETGDIHMNVWNMEPNTIKDLPWLEATLKKRMS